MSRAAMDGSLVEAPDALEVIAFIRRAGVTGVRAAQRLRDRVAWTWEREPPATLHELFALAVRVELDYLAMLAWTVTAETDASAEEDA